MSRSEMQRDLGRALQTEIGRVIMTRLKIARQVLEPGDLGIILIEAAVSTTLTAAATIAATSQPEKAGEIIDYTLSVISKSVLADRDRVLAAVRRGEGEEL